MSLSHFLPAIAIPSTACGECDPDSLPVRLNRGLVCQPTTSHPPSYAVAALGRLQRRNMKRHGSNQSVSGLSPIPREKTNTAPVPLEEYEALPPMLRKKCFSSHERLRIAQQTTNPDKHTNLSPSLSARTSQDTFQHSVHSMPRPSFERTTSAGAPVPNLSLTPRTPKQLQARQSFISPDQALWFLSLPPKVRRQQFGSQERTLLTERCESILQHAAPEWAFPCDLTSTSRPDSHSSAEPSVNFSDDKIEEFETDILELERLYVGRVPSTSSPDRQRPPSAKENVQPADHDPLPVSPIEALPQVPKHTRSVSRMSSPVQAIFPPLSFARDPDETEHSRRHGRAMSYSDLATLPRQLASAGRVSSPPAAPSFYHDHQTRQKLRRYVLSPEKFDEAVEFGFPTTAADEESRDKAPSLNMIARPSMDDESRPPSVFESDAEEDSPSLDVREPSTPDPTVQTLDFIPMSHEGISDIDIVATRTIPENPRPSKASKTLQADFDALINREMTMRITLTRPELRDTVVGVTRRVSPASSWNYGSSDHSAAEALFNSGDDLVELSANQTALASGTGGGKGLFRVFRSFRRLT